MNINELKELIELRRAAKDADEKAIIDRAIEKFIDDRSHSITQPAFPWWQTQPYCFAGDLK